MNYFDTCSLEEYIIALLDQFKKIPIVRLRNIAFAKAYSYHKTNSEKGHSYYSSKAADKANSALYRLCKKGIIRNSSPGYYHYSSLDSKPNETLTYTKSDDIYLLFLTWMIFIQPTQEVISIPAITKSYYDTSFILIGNTACSVVYIPGKKDTETDVEYLTKCRQIYFGFPAETDPVNVSSSRELMRIHLYEDKETFETLRFQLNDCTVLRSYRPVHYIKQPEIKSTGFVIPEFVKGDWNE